MKVHIKLDALFLPHPDLRLVDGVVEAESTMDALREVLKRPGVVEFLSNLANKSLRCEAREVAA